MYINYEILAIFYGLVAIITMLSAALKRKYNLKQFVALPIFLANLIYFFNSNIGGALDTTAANFDLGVRSIIPFGNVIFSASEDVDVIAYYQNLNNDYFITLVIFVLIWSLTFLVLNPKLNLKAMIIKSSAILLPINTFIMLACYFNVSKGNVFDTGSYLVLFLVPAAIFYLKDKFSKDNKNSVR